MFIALKDGRKQGKRGGKLRLGGGQIWFVFVEVNQSGKLVTTLKFSRLNNLTKGFGMGEL